MSDYCGSLTQVSNLIQGSQLFVEKWVLYSSTWDVRSQLVVFTSSGVFSSLLEISTELLREKVRRLLKFHALILVFHKVEIWWTNSLTYLHADPSKSLYKSNFFTLKTLLVNLLYWWMMPENLWPQSKISKAWIFLASSSQCVEIGFVWTFHLIWCHLD